MEHNGASMAPRFIAAFSVSVLIGTAAVAEPPFQGWRSVETEHFLIIYEPKDLAAAQELLACAEDVYRSVTERAGSASMRIPVILRGRTAAATGFYTNFPHRIEISITAPSDATSLGRVDSWLRFVLTHELVHFLDISSREGLFGTLSYVFGHDLTVLSLPFSTGWFVEGQPVLYETLFTSGGRGRDPFFEMLYKAPILEGRFWSVSQSAYDSSYAPQERIYVAGYLLVETLERRFGAGTVARIRHEFLRLPFLGLDRAVRKVTGESLDSVFQRIKQELEERYAEAARLPSGRRLSPMKPGDWYLPRPTKAGWFAYVSALDSTPGIYRLGLDKADELAVAGRLTDPFSLDATADGRLLAYTRVLTDLTHLAGQSSFSDLFLHDRASGRTRQLTTGRRLWHPALSPDGSRLAAVEKNGSSSRLVEVDPANGRLSVLYDPGSGRIYNPRFDPAGRRLVFTLEQNGKRDLAVFDGSETKVVLAALGSGCVFPVFSGPDKILFSSDQDGGMSLYELELDTGELFRVARDRVGAWAGVMVEDRLVYGSYSSDGFCLREYASGEMERFPAADQGKVAVPAAPKPLPLPDSRPYLDLPCPLLWYPYLSLSGPLAGGIIDLPLGLTVEGASLLQRHQFLSNLAWNPVRSQPDLALDYSFNPRWARFYYNFRQHFKSGTREWKQEAGNSLGIAVPLLYLQTGAATASLNGQVSTTLSSTRSAPDSFTFSEGMRLDPERELSARAGLSFLQNWLTAPRALFGRLGYGAGFQTVWHPAVLDEEDGYYDAIASLSFLLPSPLPFQSWGLQVRGSYSDSGSVEDLLPPRGGADWEPGDGDAKLMASLDYRVPFGLFDDSALGLTVLALGAILRAELGWYAAEDGGLEPLDDIYLGCDLDGRIRVLNLPLELHLSLTVRVDRGFAQAPGLEDVWLAVLFSNAFSSSLRQRPDPDLDPRFP